MRFLVLYEELATYFLTCLNHLAETSDCSILVYMKKVNAVAPFNFNTVHKNITLIEREKHSDEEILNSIKQFNPTFTYLSGWIHKPYIHYIKTQKLQNVIIGFDNQYTGSMKQLLGAIYFRMFFKPFIKAAFVPGSRQVKFAQKLGFKADHISTNVYCCDYELYNNYYKETKDLKGKSFPKKFIFVGRYIHEKGIDVLWDAFIELQQEQPNEWELYCLGKGTLQPIQHPKIKHLGFVQPDNFLSIIRDTGVFVLPSFFEPWGVVVHEFACAGYPLVSTNNVGATELFIKDGINGLVINANNKLALKTALKKIVSLSDTELHQMGEQSLKLSQQITPEIWKQSLLKLVHVK